MRDNVNGNYAWRAPKRQPASPRRDKQTWKELSFSICARRSYRRFKRKPFSISHAKTWCTTTSYSTIRRVDYDVEKELKALSSCGLPHADWIAKSLHTGSF